MSERLRDCLLRQLETSWALASYHLDGLSTEDCLWRPSPDGAHVRQSTDGSWRADWPPVENYSAGPPSIGWISWHMIYWWSLALDRNFASSNLQRSDVPWPGSADAVRTQLARLHDEWRRKLQSMTDGELCSSVEVRWPFDNRALGDLFAWANVELTKNAAEIGLLRFIRGTSSD